MYKTKINNTRKINSKKKKKGGGENELNYALALFYIR